MPNNEAPCQARLKGRHTNGRFKAGHSGNPNGRPRKEPEEPKLLDELIAKKLLEKVTVTGADGKRRKVSLYEKIVEDLLVSLATAKPRERLQMLEGMDKRGLFHKMKIMAEDNRPNPFDDEHDSWLEQGLAVAAMKATAWRIKSPPQKKDADGEQYPDVFGPPLDD